MKVAVDISLYPLDADFIPPIKDVIARLNAHEQLEIWTNAMSTQIVGEFDDVMDALRNEIGATFAQLPKAVFAIKILNNPVLGLKPMPLGERLLQQAEAFSALELIAVLLAIAYLVLAIRQNIWCWLCAGISTAIYVWLFIGARLYMESALNGFYFLMAIYGWIVWNTGRNNGHKRPVVVWPFKTHAVAILSITAASAVNGYLLSGYTDAAYPYIDSLTTWSAIWATFLVARKVLENWWYWLAIDSVSILIYWSRDLQLTSMLFVIYVIMIPFGLFSWTRSYRERPA